MGLTALKLLVLLCLLIIPLRGPITRRRAGPKRPGKTIARSNYGINENGNLEKVFTKTKEEE